MSTETPALYFPYYQNVWNIIKFKPQNEQLIWFQTMSKMMFEGMSRPKEPVVSFTSSEERVVWDAYNTILPALSKVMKISKFATAEFRERARINGKKGGRPRKIWTNSSDSTDCSDSWCESDTFIIDDAEGQTGAISSVSDAALDCVLATDKRKDERVAVHVKAMKAKFPDIDAFLKWVRKNTPPINLSVSRDENCRTYVFERLWETGFCEAKTGEPIKNLFNVINRICSYYILHKKDIMDSKQGKSQEAAFANEERQHEAALDDFYRKRIMENKTSLRK